MSYYRDVYLNSEDWRNLRAAVIAIKAPDGRCLSCKRKRKLDAHHVYYRRLWNVKIKDLIPLCRECHDFIHVLVKWMKRFNPGEHPHRYWGDVCHILRKLGLYTGISRSGFAQNHNR